ncbi:MAG: DUF3570 domain-containing protein [Magnetococcales bacterium]|nr:DUF3570 domain-containing protein [Magnetococcales bacterium]NGZ06239.1 DUF3570 domain-containing protein [Magnetococcales bacterium]
MQLKPNPLGVMVCGAASTLPLILHAAEGDKIGFKQMRYHESDDRISVNYSLLEIQKEIGTDHSVRATLSFDTISGGTPIWVDAVSGASGSATAQADGRITVLQNWVDEETNETRTVEAGGNISKNGFVYRNTQLEDERRAINLRLTRRTPDRDEITIGGNYSEESDFTSKEGSLSYLYNLDASRNRSITLASSYQLNTAFHPLYATWKDFHVIQTQLGYTHTFSKYSLGQLNLFHSRQSGTLSNPYQTILRFYTTDGLFWRAVEMRPDTRTSSGISGTLVTKIFDDTALHSSYRFYSDDWKMDSHTLEWIAHTRLDEDWVISPMLRYYTQNQAFFHKSGASGDHFNDIEFGSVDQRLGDYHSTTLGIGIEKKLTEGWQLNLHAASQKQSNGLNMTWFSLGIDYGF